MSVIASPMMSVPGALAAAAGGGTGAAAKTAVAVAPSHVMYAHFQHVSGVAAPEGVNGVSVSRLKILDTLIERLSQLRENRVKLNEIPEGGGGAEQIGLLIDMFKQRLETAGPYKNSLLPAAGTFFNLQV